MIKKNLPAMIERRISDRCSNKELFKKHKDDYEQALKKSGYHDKLQYQDSTEQKKTPRRRYPKIFWFSPPYNLAVKTKIGREFLNLIEKHFPPGHKWHSHFNQHTIKLSYSCTKNVAAHITSHNLKLLKGPTAEPGCNCRDKDSCPLEGKCLTDAIVYQGTIQTYNQNPVCLLRQHRKHFQRTLQWPFVHPKTPWHTWNCTLQQSTRTGHKPTTNTIRNKVVSSQQVLPLDPRSTPTMWCLQHREDPYTAEAQRTSTRTSKELSSAKCPQRTVCQMPT